jgi:hypothetical protein
LVGKGLKIKLLFVAVVFWLAAVIPARSVWVKDKDGWSAVVHGGWQYME